MGKEQRTSERVSEHVSWWQRRAQRLAEAEDGTAKRAERSPREQLEKLDERLGSGMGAERERERLEAML